MPRPFAVIGITAFLVLALFYNASGETAVIVFAVFTLALLISLPIKSIRRNPYIMVVLASASVACLMLVCTNEFYYYPQLTLAESTHNSVITITSECEERNGKFYYEGTADKLDGSKNNVRLRLVFTEAPEFEPYDVISGSFRYYALGSSSDDAAASFKSENRFLGAYPSGDYHIESVAEDSKPIGYKILVFRASVRRAIMHMLPNDYGGLCTALVLGDRSRLSDRAYADLKNCGITHIICVSGLHISIWSSALLYILRKLRLKEKLASAIACPFVILLMMAAGMTYSVIRSGIMMLLYLVSVIISRRKDSLNSLGIALLLILVTNPFSAGSVSLQLSALATMGIVIYSEKCAPAVDGWLKDKKYGFIFRKPLNIILVTAAAMAFCLPVTLVTFGTFNLSVFPANFLILGAAEVCMICAVLGACVAGIGITFFNLPGFVAGIAAKYILWVTSHISEWNFLNIHLSETEAYLVLAGVFSACYLFTLMAYTGKKIMPFAAVMTAFFVVASTVTISVQDYGITDVRVFDSGNTTSVMVSHKGEVILIGCGGETYGSAYSVKNAVEDEGGQLAAVFLPADEDYCTSDFFDIAAYFIPEKLYCPADMNTAGISAKTEKMPLDDCYDSGGISVKYYGDICTYIVKTDDITLAVCCESAKAYNTDIMSGADVLITRGDCPGNVWFTNLCLVVIEADNTAGCYVQDELTALGIKAAATAENGDILIRAENGSVSAERI